MSDHPNPQPPPLFLKFGEHYPEVMAAYNAFGSAAHEAGPLDMKTRALIKLAIAAGARLEGAVHSHARRALREACTPEEIRHAILLTATTIGFPSMMAAMSWVDDELPSR
jgi:4-carboxymuconolactone decarboxylase